MEQIYHLKQLKQIRMDSDNMKYAVDRIEEKLVVLEDINTKEKKEVEINILPENIQDGSIIKYENGIYSIDNQEYEERLSRIREKMERLKRLKKHE